MSTSLNREKSVTKIVLTGGPCAGKTTASGWIREAFEKLGYHVMFVPESATELIVGGISPAEIASRDFQRLNMLNQINKERLFEDGARAHPSDRVLIVCDRGVMDSEAYMPDGEFPQLLTEMGLNRILMRDSYDAVLHLVTAANGAERAYTLSTNEARSETPEQARDVDERIMRAWTGHPHLRVIGNDGSFEDKMRQVVREVAAVLGEPEPMEVERKFLIKMPSDAWMESQQGHSWVDIIQTYLSSENPGTERRIRQRGRDGSYVYTLTTKSEVRSGDALSRIEMEHSLSESEYLSLMMDADTASGQVRKTRHLVICDGQYFEIDTYPFDRELAILEVELPSEDAEVRIPDGIEMLREVTDDARYRNASLARHAVRTLAMPPLEGTLL